MKYIFNVDLKDLEEASEAMKMAVTSAMTDLCGIKLNSGNYFSVKKNKDSYSVWKS